MEPIFEVHMTWWRFTADIPRCNKDPTPSKRETGNEHYNSQTRKIDQFKCWNLNSYACIVIRSTYSPKLQ